MFNIGCNFIQEYYEYNNVIYVKILNSGHLNKIF